MYNHYCGFLTNGYKSYFQKRVFCYMYSYEIAKLLNSISRKVRINFLVIEDYLILNLNFEHISFFAFELFISFFLNINKSEIRYYCC